MTMSAVELRPRSVGELIGLTFSLYRRNFPLFVGITAVVAVPVLALLALSNLLPAAQFALVPGSTESAASDELGAAFFGLTALTCCATVLAAIAGIFWPWMEGALTHSVIERVLGRSPGLRASYAETRPRFASLWSSNLLANLGLYLPFLAVYLLFLGGLVVLGVFAVASSESGSDGSSVAIGVLSLLCLPLFVATLVLMVVLAINWAFRVPAIVGEGVDAIASFSRSTALARGDRWRILGRYVVLALIEFLLVALPLLIVVAITLVLAFGLAGTASDSFVIERASLPAIVALTVVSVGLSFFTTLLITPVRMIFTALNYIDMRVRKENLALQVAPAEPVTVPDSVPAVVPIAVPMMQSVMPAPTAVVSATPATPTISPASSAPAMPEPPLESLSPGQRIGVLFNRLRAEGDNPQVLSDLGLAYLQVGDLYGAAEALTRARALAPTDADIAYNLMLVQLERKDMNAAKALMSEYLRLETNADDLAIVRNSPRFKSLLPE
jgi:hypothetical protein